jgi:hypothetical protein
MRADSKGGKMKMAKVRWIFLLFVLSLFVSCASDREEYTAARIDKARKHYQNDGHDHGKITNDDDGHDHGKAEGDDHEGHDHDKEEGSDHEGHDHDEEDAEEDSKDDDGHNH